MFSDAQKFVLLLIPFLLSAYGFHQFLQWKNRNEHIRGTILEIEWKSRNHQWPMLKIHTPNGLYQNYEFFYPTSGELDSSNTKVGDEFEKLKDSSDCLVNGKRIRCLGGA